MKKQLIKDAVQHEHHGQNGVAFTYQDKRYWVHWVYASQIETVRTERRNGQYIDLITGTEDFGGCGMDARKPYIQPFQGWLDSKATVLESAEKTEQSSVK